MVGGGQRTTGLKGHRFAAFISYAHADAVIAAKLQSRLERYRLPKHLARAHTGGQAGLGQMFRDREDLAAAPSLSDAIRNAISKAEALIVVCSPDAVASRWVGEEIALFRTLHPNRMVLAAIVRGTPEEAFPAALTKGGNEPLAADLRKEADGPLLGFLKIVAGIAGVPLDALIQRDTQRRVRRVMWITGSALAAVLIMSVMTTLALQARNEAARQRAEAEGLVEYMLTDLRDKLKGVGRLDVMDGVNKRAGNYYGDGSVKGRLLKAQVLHAMGEDFDKQGDLARAEAKFRLAHVQTAALIKNFPTNGDVVFAHAQSEYWVGYMHYVRKDYQKAAPYWSNYLTQAQRLAALPGEHRRGAKELGYANNNLCVLAVDIKRDLTEPVQRCRRAVEAQRALAMLSPKDPAAQLSLANSIAWLADAMEANGALAEAIGLREEQITIIERLIAADPPNRDYAEFRLTTILALARLDRKAGRPGAARTRLSDAHRMGVALKSHDPRNAIWAAHLNRLERELDRVNSGSTS